MNSIGEIFRRLLIAPPIVLGVVLFMYMTRDSGDGDAAPPPEVPVAVRVLKAAAEDYTITVSGYGRVEAVRSWSAVSQVEGRVVALAPEVAVGAVILEGAEFARIDVRDYEIALSKARAARDSASASLEELAVNERNYRERLVVEEEILENFSAELDRQERLVASGNTARSNLDAARRSYLNQQKTVIDLKATLALVPAQRTSQQANLASAEADIEQAERDIGVTVFAAPFTGRVVSKNISEGQYARTGDTLVTLEAIDASEVEALFQPRDLTNMVLAVGTGRLAAAFQEQNVIEAFDILKSLNFDVRVRSTAGLNPNEWPAEIRRTSGQADEATGSFGIVVQIDNPHLPSPQENRPPLNNGTFVEVILSMDEFDPAILVPRAAVRTDPSAGSFVYVADAENRLRRREVRTGSAVGEDIIIAEGLSEGDTVVLSDPQPALDGLLLAPVFSDEAGGGA